MSAAPPAPVVPKPAAISLAGRYFTIATVAGVAAGLALVAEPWVAPLAVLFLFAAAVFGGFGWLAWRDAWGTAHAAAALQALTRGDLEGVEAAHGRVPARSMRRGTVARAVAVQTALVAMFRGSPDGAVSAIEPALAPRVRLTTTTHERLQMAGAYGVRALAHAMNGDAVPAQEDATMAESCEEAMPEALARAALARALILARSGDLTALAAQLAKHGSLMLEHTLPRERALVRALRKMAHARARSVYREPSRPTDTPNVPGTLAGWIARVAPEAAAYAAEDAGLAERSETARAPVATAEAKEAVAHARRLAKKRTPALRRWSLGIAGGVLIIGAAPFVMAILEPSPRHAAPLPPTVIAPHAFAFDPSTMTLAIAGVVLLAAKLASQFVRSRRLNLALIAANRAAALGDANGARLLLAKAKRSSMHLFAAAAGATVARLAEQRADFAGCILECDAAIAKVGTARVSVADADQIMPGLLGLRGLALAATGRSAEALAELATLHARYPSFSHLALLDFRIRLASAVRRGDLEEARGVALQRTAELPLPLRDDLLADLVVAVGGEGLPQEEMQRLDAELREDEATRRWVDAMAPGLRERLAGAVHGGVRVAGAAADARADAQAVAEVTAEAEHEREAEDTEGAPPSPRRSTLRA